MIEWIIAIIGLVIGVIGIIFINIATKFNTYNTTPFSKYTFANLCYDLEDVWMYCICVGFGVFGGICLGKFYNMEQETTLPFNIWIDVRQDEDFEKVKANLNDYEMVLVTSKTRSKFQMSLFKDGYFLDYGRHDRREMKIRPKYIMRIDVSDKHIIKDGYEYIK